MDKTAISSLHLESCIACLVAIQLDRGGHPVSHVALLTLQDHYRPVGQVEEEPAVVLKHVDVGKEMALLRSTHSLSVMVHYILGGSFVIFRRRRRFRPRVSQAIV